MLTLELGKVELGLLLGGIGLACIGIGVVAWLLWRQHRQLQRSLTQVCGQVAAFAEASMSVAQTVEQSLVVAPQARGHGQDAKGSAGRWEVLQVAARRLAQQQSPAAVQQALGLKDDEMRLLGLAAAHTQAPLMSNQKSSNQKSSNSPAKGAARAVA